MDIGGSWAVLYDDGTWLGEWDKDHPRAINGQVPFRAIDWPRVKQVKLESSYASSDIEVPPAPDGHRWHLRGRYFASLQGFQVRTLMLVCAKDGEVNAESTIYVMYWAPDGTVYESPHFWSKEFADYVGGILFNVPRTLPAKTEEVKVGVNAAALA